MGVTRPWHLAFALQVQIKRQKGFLARPGGIAVSLSRCHGSGLVLVCYERIWPRPSIDDPGAALLERRLKNLAHPEPHSEI